MPHHAHRKRFQYLSLDVEGAELRVLQSVPDLASRPFDVALVECQLDRHRAPKYAGSRGVASLLNQSGYAAVPFQQASSGGGVNCLYALPPFDELARRLEPWPRAPNTMDSLVAQLAKLDIGVTDA